MSSSRPAWVQALRGVVFFAIGAAVLLGMSMGTAAAKRAWDRRQEQQRWQAQLASEGLAEVCGKGVDQQCAERAANKAKVAVAYLNDRYADLTVSIGTQNFKAYQNGPAGDLWTQPRFAADRAKRLRVDRTVVVDGTAVTLWAVIVHHCGCPYGVLPSKTTSSTTTPAHPRIKAFIARATWYHDGKLYELGTVFGDDPVATLTMRFGYIGYASPSR